MLTFRSTTCEGFVVLTFLYPRWDSNLRLHAFLIRRSMQDYLIVHAPYCLYTFLNRSMHDFRTRHSYLLTRSRLLVSFDSRMPSSYFNFNLQDLFGLSFWLPPILHLHSIRKITVTSYMLWLWHTTISFYHLFYRLIYHPISIFVLRLKNLFGWSRMLKRPRSLWCSPRSFSSLIVHSRRPSWY